MKKKISILIILLIVLSIFPISIAEYGRTSNELRETNNSEKEQETDSKERAERISNRIENTLERLKQTKERMGEEKEELENKTSNFRKVRSLLKECKDDESVRCKGVRIDVRVKSKPYMLGAVERMIKSLENAKTKLESSEIESDIKTALILRITTDLIELNKIKRQIESIENNLEKEKVIEIAKSLKEQWKGPSTTLKLVNFYLVDSRFAGILKKVDKLEDGLERVLKKLEKEGKDTTELESEIEIFKEKIKSAKEKRNKAASLFLDIPKFQKDKDSNSNEGIREAHQLYKEAKQDLKEAHQSLQKIKKIIRTLNGVTEKTEEESETETTQETEVEA